MAKEKPKVDWRVLCIGLLCITGLGIYALSQGINGVLFTAVIGIIAGVLGYTLPGQIKTK